MSKSDTENLNPDDLMIADLPELKGALEEARQLLERLKARKDETDPDRYERLHRRYEEKIEELEPAVEQLTEQGETRKLELEDRLAHQQGRAEDAEAELDEIKQLHEEGAMDEETYREERRRFQRQRKEAENEASQIERELDEVEFYLTETGEVSYDAGGMQGVMDSARDVAGEGAANLLDQGRELFADAGSRKGAGVSAGTRSASDWPRHAGSTLAEAVGNAATALGKIAVNPVANLSQVRGALGIHQAVGVGVVFAIVATVCMTLGLHLIFDTVFGFAYRPSVKPIVQLFGASMASFASLAVMHFAARTIFDGDSDYGTDVLVAGTALLPTSQAVLFIGLIGISYYRVAGVLGVFAVCYVVLILYTGCSRLANLSEAVSAPLIPVILILSGWLAQVLFGAIV
jgi:hypothetical protein